MALKKLPDPPAKEIRRKDTPKFVKYYLFVYNVLSALGWSYVLVNTLLHLSGLLESARSVPPSPQTAASTLSRIFSSLPYLKSAAPTRAQFQSRVPPWLLPFYKRATTTYAAVGLATALVQTAAILEVVHAALGWVRSPIQTTAMQVASRLFLVWGVTEQFEVARTNPLYTSMVFSWSLVEVVRYSFYAASILGHEPYPLLYARYTFFYVLYPLGASSEAFLNLSTLPTSVPGFGWRSWVRGMWTPADCVRALLFVIWWPCLYYMYTYMIKQRRKVLGSGPGRRLGEKPKLH